MENLYIKMWANEMIKYYLRLDNEFIMFTHTEELDLGTALIIILGPGKIRPICYLENQKGLKEARSKQV